MFERLVLFLGGRTSLRKLLINMRFTYKTINNKRLVFLSELIMDHAIKHTMNSLALSISVTPI